MDNNEQVEECRIRLCRMCSAPIDIIWDIHFHSPRKNCYYCSSCASERREIALRNNDKDFDLVPVKNSVAIDNSNQRAETGSFSFVQRYSISPPNVAASGCSFICIDCSKQHKILKQLLILCNRNNKEHRVIMAYDHSIRFERGVFVEALEYSPIMN